MWSLGLLLLSACQLPVAPLPTAYAGYRPFGAKSVAEICMDVVAPALVSAVHDASGVWIRELPLTPERVWRALREADLKYSR
ncbi:MAG: hypothetical protein V3S81_09465 [Anaerolineales bacterium]